MLGGGSSWNPFKREDPKELVRKWKASLRSEVRGTEREMASLILEQKKAAKAIKEAAKRNDMGSAKASRPFVVAREGGVARCAGLPPLPPTNARPAPPAAGLGTRGGAPARRGGQAGHQQGQHDVSQRPDDADAG
jgi:hypothetical protein